MSGVYNNFILVICSLLVDFIVSLFILNIQFQLQSRV